jgi:tRNA nucleotidyltransferase (CCA-adding enzyme)
VTALVRHHLAPATFIKGQASARGYRRLARKLEEGGASVVLLERVARADHFGRTTPEALARSFPEGEEFLRRARDLEVEEHAVKDVVLGRHLIRRGFAPGPHFGPILRLCRDVQDETGLSDPEAILDRVLHGPAPPAGAAELP